MKEADLYQPVKTYLEAQGYRVKGEIGACDLVALRGDEDPVIVELKISFSLALVLQGIARQSMTDAVYLAVPPFSGKGITNRQRDVLALCRRLGLGLMTVRTGARPFVEVLVDPGPYQPRKVKTRRTRLLREFERRVGDPVSGGSSTRTGRMTAYRQDALRLARFLAADPAKASDVAVATGVAKARQILYRDVYGWFERVGLGIYALTPKGKAALETYAEALAALSE